MCIFVFKKEKRKNWEKKNNQKKKKEEGRKKKRKKRIQNIEHPEKKNIRDNLLSHNQRNSHFFPPSFFPPTYTKRTATRTFHKELPSLHIISYFQFKLQKLPHFFLFFLFFIIHYTFFYIPRDYISFFGRLNCNVYIISIFTQTPTLVHRKKNVLQTSK